MMSTQQVSISELLLSLDSPELQEAEQVRAAVNQQLSTDRGGAVLSSLVDYYLDSSSSQVVLLLSSIREPHHKTLLEKLNESLNRPGSRLAGMTLLGHLIRKQPPWVHHISRSALLASLLRCLKTETDVVVLITGVLVLITLLPMIPQAGKQHIYDFFDVFGRLAAWSYKNPGHVPLVHLVHLHAGVYSLFHRLYGMFPCNFMSYLRLHYSMKENLDTFQEVVKPMLDHVRVHPELVTGTQDYELDPSRWRCYEVHDIMIECSRVSLDPLESSCEEDMYLSLRDTHLDLTSSPQNTETVSSSGLFLSERLPHLTTLNNSYIQADEVTWSPSSQCGLSTPPPEPSAPPLSRTTSISGVTSPPSSAVPTAPPTEGNQDGGVTPQVKLVTEPEGSSIQPITEQEERGHSDVIDDISGDVSSQQPVLLASTPSPGSAPPSVLCFTPPHSSRSQVGGSAPSAQSPAPSYGPLFELALPRAATFLIGRMTQEAMERTAGEQETAEGGGGGGRRRGGGGEREGEDREEEQTSVSPLEVLDQLIVHGHDAHQHISRRWSAVSRGDRSLSGGKHQSMKTKEGEELQSLRSQLLLVHSQLQYERFRRQQHAVRNRRLLRRVINATTLEESSVAMKGQLEVQEEEIRSLRTSLQEEHRRYSHLQQDTHTHTNQVHTHTQQLLLQHLEEQRDRQRLEVELQECQSRLRELEAELQRANNKAYNAEHQLTQLSLKLCSSEQLQQQMFLMNQQLVLLRETNRTLREHVEHLEGGESQHTVASMLQCTLGNEFQRLKDSDVLQRQKLEAANHRTAELETQLAKRDQLILDQKKLLEDTKTQSRGELVACESRCAALRRVAQTLQTETLHLYSRIHLDAPQDAPRDAPQDARRNGTGGASPAPPSGHKPHPPFSSSAVGVINGGVETLSSSPLHLLSSSSSPLHLLSSSSPLSLSPIDSPLAVGSFLEQRARQLFRPTNHSQEEEQEQEEEEEEQEEQQEEEEEQEEQQEEEEEQEEQQEEEAQPESPPLAQEAEFLLTGSPQMEVWASGPRPPSGPPAPPADLTLAVRQRRHELSIMDYDETLPEY